MRSKCNGEKMWCLGQGSLDQSDGKNCGKECKTGSEDCNAVQVVDELSKS